MAFTDNEQSDVTLLSSRIESAKAITSSDFRSVTQPLEMRLNTLPSGILEVPAAPSTRVSIHVGRASQVYCHKGGNHSGLIVHGELDIVPAGLFTVWEIKDKCNTFSLRLPPSLMAQAAIDLELDPSRIELINHFQIRDPQIEHIGWALKAEMESGFASGALFLDSLATALAAHLLRRYNSRSLPVREVRGGMAGSKLRQVITYIEDNLDNNLSLAEIAEVANLSVSHLKVVFRQSMGLSVHKYVIRRRVERARDMLIEGQLPVSQIALATGFSHQSHLARHMRRLLGITPAEIRKRYL